MGCCGCRPKTEVTEDPNVVMYTPMGSFIMVDQSGSGAQNDTGLLYVKDNRLCCEATVGSKLCCKCCKNSWSLSKVKAVKVMNSGERVTYNLPRRGLRHEGEIVLSSDALMISILNNQGGTNTLLAYMPDAQNFGPQLSKYINVADNEF